MREVGIRAKAPRRFRVTTESEHRLPVAPNLLNRSFHVAQPNEVWASDITYIWTAEGWLYLAVVLDLHSRLVVGWAVSYRIDTDLTLLALDRAIAPSPRGDAVDASLGPGQAVRGQAVSEAPL